MGRRLQSPARTLRARSTSEEAGWNDLLAALTAPIASSRDLAQVMLTLPKAHIRVLDTEASVYGLRRYQFLETPPHRRAIEADDDPA